MASGLSSCGNTSDLECSNGVTKVAAATSEANESSQPNKPIHSEHGQKFLVKDVILSHSDKQKSFVRQLYRDLTNQGMSCFFDQDRESLPLGEDFPSRIFEAAKTSKAVVLLLSKDFFESNITPDNEKWKLLGISTEEQTKWYHALNALRRFNGLNFPEGDYEGEFRDKIVKEIWHIITPSPRYHVPRMQGQVRMCQLVADSFNTVHPDENRIRMAGLYGIPGHGKTTLGKAFCNFKLGDFEGKVCHLEFCRGDPFERLKLALQFLTHCPPWILQTLTNPDQAQVELYRRVRGQRVLASIKESTLGIEEKNTALKCANRCSFKEVGSRHRTFHPLSLKAFGGHLFSKYGSYLSKWVAEIEGLVDRPGYGLDDMLAVLGEAFDNMRPEYRTIVMLLTVYKLPDMSTQKVIEWLAIICNKEIVFIEKALRIYARRLSLKSLDLKFVYMTYILNWLKAKQMKWGDGCGGRVTNVVHVG
ncbi:hypothetical protein SUGI_0867920 [Cryptomeria japonica]|nr:hypothetical protein SUGI_0867920 [Cryptomeria japonica]